MGRESTKERMIKNMTTQELIDSLNACGKRTPHCSGCVFANSTTFPDCYEYLKIRAVKELQVLMLKEQYLEKQLVKERLEHGRKN